MEKVFVYIADIGNLNIDEVLPRLSEARCERIERCVDETKKRQLAASELLCAYALAQHGTEVKLPLSFSYDESGKPYIEGCPLQFNLSHSGMRVCCAVAQMPVGADIQRMEQRDFAKLSEKFCSQMEREELLRYSGEKQMQFFYELWTRKESLVKRDGIGIRTDLRAVDASWGHVRSFTQKEYMCSVAADKAFALVVREAAV